MERSKVKETSLVLTTASIILFLRYENPVFLYIGIGIGITGILIKPLATYIAILWFKLAELLSFVFSKIILGTLFFVFLVPISFIYKLTSKDKLGIRKSRSSMWTERNHIYSSKDLENIW